MYKQEKHLDTHVLKTLKIKSNDFTDGPVAKTPRS